MNVPTHLQHKPIIAVDDYARKDGVHAGNTDARALSIGQAQYDEDEFSAKVFRHTGSSWSRQSEELPLHRVLDLAILLATILNRQSSTQPSLSTSLSEIVVDPTRYDDLINYIRTNHAVFIPRLQELKALL
jgi:hypothetical protein